MVYIISADCNTKQKDTTKNLVSKVRGHSLELLSILFLGISYEKLRNRISQGQIKPYEMPLINLGAINTLTGEYVSPRMANKKDTYSCPDCKRQLIVVQGQVKAHHFRHKVDKEHSCSYYDRPGESDIHKGAKLALQTLLKRRIPITFIRACADCDQKDEYELDALPKSADVHLEYEFIYKGPELYNRYMDESKKIADVACVDNNSIVCLFEIYNTHKTSSDDRPEPWFEVDAKELLKIVNEPFEESMKIPCIRCEKCDICLEKDAAKIQKRYDALKRLPLEKLVKDSQELEFFVRYTLGERNLRASERGVHLRFDFHQGEENNESIISLFNKYYGNKNIKVHAWKGTFCISILKNSVNITQSVFKKNKSEGHMYPDGDQIEYNGSKTVDILMELLRMFSCSKN
jgi:hypothetical protein